MIPPPGSRMSIDGAVFEQWDAAPGFFLKVFDLPAGRLAGASSASLNAGSALATLTVQSAAVSGAAPIPTSIEQFDLQDAETSMWGYDEGWQEAESSPALGLWRWTSERSTLRIVGPPRAVEITLRIESPLRYFDEPPVVRIRAGDREIAVATVDSDREWAFEVPAEALAASMGALTIETNQTFVPADRGTAADNRRLGLRIFSISARYR